MYAGVGVAPLLKAIRIGRSDVICGWSTPASVMGFLRVVSEQVALPSSSTLILTRSTSQVMSTGSSAVELGSG